MRHSRREKILSLMLALVLALLILLPDGRNTSVSEEITIDPDNTVIPLDEGIDGNDVDLDVSGEMEGGVDGADVDLDVSGELEYGEVEAYATQAPAETPEHFEQGYVRVRREDYLYADPDLTELAGAFLDSGLVYARIYRMGEQPDADVLLVRFDTPDILEADREPETGYIRFDAVFPLAPEDAAKAGEALENEGARRVDGVLLPVIAFESAVEEPEPTEAPEAEPTEAPEAEPTEAPKPEPTEAPEAEHTEAPEAEPTEAPEAEPTETPEPEPTETPEPEPTGAPEAEPTDVPEAEPTEVPEPEPTETPEPEPTETPEPEPTETPEPEPTETSEPEPTEPPEPEPTETPEPEPTETPEPTAAPGDMPEVAPVDLLGRTMADRVNLRAEPNTDCAVLAVIEPMGTEVAITGAVDVDGVTWYRVLYEGFEGYVRGNLLAVSRNPGDEAGGDDTVEVAPEAAEDVDETDLSGEDGEAALVSYPAFEDSKAVDGVLVKVTADEGIFPEGSKLYVRRVPVRARKAVREAVEQERDEDVNVAVSYVFDIKVLDPEGQEIDFTAEQGVQVSFSAAEVANENLETQVYHVAEEEDGSLTAQPMDVTITEQETATVTTDGFSYYTVEFTYNKLQYVMMGDSTIPLAEVLDFVGLTGEVAAVEVSDSSLFSASNETGEWMVTARKPFYSGEWMKVVIGGIDFEIEYMFTVTDAVVFPPAYTGGNSSVVQQGDIETFLMGSDMPRATICIDKSAFETTPSPEIPEGSSFTVISGAPSYREELNGKVGYKGPLKMSADNSFDDPDDWITYRYSNAAILEDGSRADVLITYSDVHIYTPIPGYNGWNQNKYSSPNNYTALVNGRQVFIGNSVQCHIGVKLTATIEIVKPGTRETVPGSFYYTMYDIDVKRGGNNYSYLYDAENNFNYSEQVTVESGALSKVYVPEVDFKDAITGGNSSDGHGVRITPAQVEFSDNDPGSFRTGFGVLADAKGFRITIGGSGGSWYNRGGSPFYNTIQSNLFTEAVGQLYARKELAPGYATDSDIEREWTLDATVKGSRFTATAKAGETSFIGNFVKGDDFSLTESAEDMGYYETTYKVEQGPALNKLTEVSSGSGKEAFGNDIQCCNLVTFTNKRRFDKLTVQKTVDSEHEEAYDAVWQFTLKVTDGLQDTPYTLLESPVKDMSQEDQKKYHWDDSKKDQGIYSFTLKHSESLDFSLPLGCKYEVIEAENPDFDPEFKNERGILVEGKGLFGDATTVNTINKDRTHHDLTLKKTVSGNMGNYGKYFKYDVTVNIPEGNGGDYAITGTLDPASMVNHRERIADANQAGSIGDVPTSIHLDDTHENTFTVWLAHGDTFTIKELPSGTGYSFTEANDLEYMVTTGVTGDTRNGGAASHVPIATVNNSTATSVTLSDTHLKRNTTVTYTNHKSEPIPTGIYDDIRAALWGLAIVLALGLVQTHCAARRNKRRTMRVRRS